MSDDIKNPDFRHKNSLLKVLANYLNKINILKKKNRELHQITETQNKIISILAHDVRNPLTSIKNIIELKQSDVLDQNEASVMMEKVAGQLNSTLEMVNNIVTWGQTQVNDNELSYLDFDLCKTAERILLSESLHSEEKGNSLLSTIKEGTLMNSNEQSVEFILRNLVSNANKFTEKGTITLSCISENGHNVLKVTDTGVGMTKEQTDKLFTGDKHSTTLGTKNEKGSGMGLVLVFELVERMNGKINVQSEINNGSTFSIIL